MSGPPATAGGSNFTSRLLINAAGEKPTIHYQDFSGNKAGCVGSEKDRSAGQLFNFTKAFHRRAQQKLSTALASVQQFLIQRGAEHAGGNRIDVHAARRPFNGE